MPTQTRPTKAERREEARLTAERLRAEQARKARRQRWTIIGVAVAVIALVTALVVAILSSGDSPDTGDPGLVPQGSLDNGAIPVGPAGLPGDTAGAAEDAVVLSVYSDYLCSYCALFEQQNSPVLEELRADGGLVVHYHPISIMDGSSGGAEYSTRSAAAVALVAELAPESFLDFHHALMANQPTDVGGFADESIARVAESAGVPADVVAMIAAGEHMSGDRSMRSWVDWATERAAEDLPRMATPTIFLNGELLEVDWRAEGALAEAIEQARAAGPAADDAGDAENAEG